MVLTKMITVLGTGDKIVQRIFTKEEPVSSEALLGENSGRR